MGIDDRMKTNKKGVQIREAEPKDANTKVKVLVDSLPDKFDAIFGKKLKEGRQVLAEHYSLRENFEGVFVAEVEGNVVGVIELSTKETKKSRQESLKPYFAHLGFFGAIRSYSSFYDLGGKC